MTRTLASTLAALLPFGAAAQRAPQILQITVERINPGHEADYAAIEERLAQFCVRLSCPNSYLALESLTAPKEVFWLVEYRSEADVPRVADAYARNEKLLAELRSAAAQKKANDIAPDPVASMATLATGGTDAPWLVGRTAFVVIADTRAPPALPAAVFATADGRRFVVAAASTRADADAAAAKLGAAARAFAVRPEWSKPDAAWVEANAELWKQR